MNMNLEDHDMMVEAKANEVYIYQVGTKNRELYCTCIMLAEWGGTGGGLYN